MPITLTLVNSGALYKLQLYLNLELPDSLVLRLYVNDYEPECDDVWPDYDECALAGYAAVTLNPDLWVASAADCVATGTYPTVTFTFNAYAGGVTIYGVAITGPDAGGPLLYQAGLLQTPYVVPADGGSLNVNLVDLMQ
jgi:hypothetical protein